MVGTKMILEMAIFTPVLSVIGRIIRPLCFDPGFQ